MFEDKTYENLLQSVLDNAPDDIDTGQGSIFYDAVSGVILKIAKLYTDLDMITRMSDMKSVSGEALDAKAAEFGIVRLSASSAKYYALFEGTTPDTGERFFHDGNYFVLGSDGSNLYFEAETSGTAQNNIPAGTAAVPVNNIEGLTAASFGAIYESGTDKEVDENMRTRLLEKIAGPAENGNRQHYKTWCESVEGVGKARITSLWNGENTVKAVLIDTEGKPLSESKVKEVQNYIDPADKGMTTIVNGKTYTVGDGLGNGVANIGAHFTAVSAFPIDIKISFSADLKEDTEKQYAQRQAAEKIEEYLKELALSANENSGAVVRISAIGAVLAELECIEDYSSLTVNSGTVNVSVDTEHVPVLTEVLLI